MSNKTHDEGCSQSLIPDVKPPARLLSELTATSADPILNNIYAAATKASRLIHPRDRRESITSEAVTKVYTAFLSRPARQKMIGLLTKRVELLVYKLDHQSRTTNQLIAREPLTMDDPPVTVPASSRPKNLNTAEDDMIAHIDRTRAITKLLSPEDIAFILDYKADRNGKTNADHKRMHRLRKKCAGLESLHPASPNQLQAIRDRLAEGKVAPANTITREQRLHENFMKM